MIIDIGKVYDTDILSATDDKSPDDTSFKNVVILIVLLKIKTKFIHKYFRRSISIINN